jgi:hypothetical protein
MKAIASQGLTRRTDYSPLLHHPLFRCSERWLYIPKLRRDEVFVCEFVLSSFVLVDTFGTIWHISPWQNSLPEKAIEPDIGRI